MKSYIENPKYPFLIFLFLMLPLIAADLSAQTTVIFSDAFNLGTIDGSKWRLGTNAGNRAAVVNNALELRSLGAESGWILTKNKYKAQNTTVHVKAVQPGDDGDIGISPNYSMSNKRGIYNQKNWYRFYTSRPSHAGPYRLLVQWKRNGVLGSSLDVTGSLVITGAIYLRLRFNTTNIYFDVSFDGVSWINTYTEIFNLPGSTLNTSFYYELAAYNTASNGVMTADDFEIRTLDTQTPAISNVAASNITISAAAISWATNEAADSQVEYGLTTSYGSVTPLDPALVTSHSVALAGLQANALYHYRVKSKDAAGNLATSGDFTFSTDVTPPIISDVAASNVTISAATISWATNEAADSQVEYGLTTSYGAVTPLDPALVTSHSVALSGLQANTLYHYRVKSKDAAGNLATSGDFTFSTDVTPPIISDVAASNVTISAATISWATNEAADSQVEYGLTTSYGAVTPLDPALVTSHSVALSGLQSNAVYHYRVKSKDAAGNLATSGDFTFSTDVTPPIISDVAASNVTISAATISWATNEAADSQVEYGLTTSYGSVTPLDPALVTSHSVALSGLQANTVYHYRVKSKDAAGNLATSGDFTFSTDVTPPIISNVAASNITISAATISWATNEAADSQVEYGLTTNYGAVTPLDPALVTSHSVALSGLQANTLYHYRVKSKDAAGNLATSGDFTFSTDVTPPIISDVAASNVTISAATISWATNEAADSQVEYGLTTSYGSVTPLDPALVTSHSVALSGLQANTLYHYRVKSKDAAGNLATSADFTFTTLSDDVTPPSISNVAANNLTSSAATISWATNEAADSQVEYGLTTSYGAVTPLDPALVTSHSVALSSLQANALYHYRVQSKDAAGNLATSADFTFTTLSDDVTPPSISNVAANNLTSSAATISWATNEAADSQVEYGLTTSYGAVTPLDPALVASHSVALAALQTNALYHYRVKSKDAAGNLATSADFTFTTLSDDVTPPSISNVAANNLTSSAATISWATNEAADSQVEYGLTTSYGASTSLSVTLVTSHSASLSGLNANTTYHYRVKSKDAAGNLATSGDFTFATSPMPPPFDVTLEAENMPIKTNGAARPPGWALWENGYLGQTVNFPGSGLHQFTLRAMGNLAEGEWSQAELRIDQVPKAVITVKASVYTDFPAEFAVAAGTHEVAIAFINDLDNPPDNRNLYVDWLRIQSTGSDSTATQPPIISGVAANNVTTSSATIVWTTDEASDSQVEYGLTVSYGSSSSLDPSLFTSHAVALSNLPANTTYHYRVKSRDAAGNLATSGDFIFTTGASISGNVAFANVQDLFNNNCVRCHQGANAPAGLVLLPGQAHANIVNVTSTEYPQWQRVQPGNRAVSWLYEKITNPTPPVGSKMASLSADETELIGAWIDQGATATPVPPYADLQFRTTTVVNGEINIAYVASFTVWGGLPPYQFSVAGGALPPGITLDPTAGMIAGVPNTVGSYDFIIRVSDSQTPAATRDQAYHLDVFNTRAHWQLPPGFAIENVVSDLHLPVNIAFVPNPGPNPTDPYFYVTLLYGDIVMVQRNFQKQTYVTGLLNFTPTGVFPGSGEMGVTGITVDPSSGDVFASMVYDAGNENFHNQVLRFHSTDGGHTAATPTTILDNIPAGISHTIQEVTIGPDGKLYVNIGDSWVPEAAPDINDRRGKVLRLNLDGSTPDDNPFPNNPVYAFGFRNPFGAAWRQADGKLYISDNGPEFDDRLAKVLPGADYGWGLVSPDLTRGAIFLWNPTVAPVAVDFMQNNAFPADYEGHLFAGLSGPTYWLGTTERGKKIQRFVLDAAGQVTSDSLFLDYVGAGASTVIGVAFGPDGLYFTDLYGENGFDQFGQTHANVYRIRSTAVVDTTRPAISNVQTANVTGTTATIVWQTNEAATRQVEYGLTASYGLVTTLQTNLLTNHSVTLSQLTPVTTYHFRALSADAAGNNAVSGDFTFTTAVLDVTPPVISAVQVDSITVTDAVVKWTTNEPASSFVDFGATDDYGSTQSSSQLVTAHRVPLSGLADSTLYHFRVRSLDGDGNSAASADGIFTTRHNYNTQIDTTLEAENMPIKTSGDARPPGWALFENGYIADSVTFPVAGSYRFTLRANGQEALGEWSMAEIRIDQAAKAVIETNSSNYTDYAVDFTVAAGAHEVAVAFINDLDAPPYGRNLYVDWLRIQNSDAGSIVVKSKFAEPKPIALPEKFVLQNYPNPFSASGPGTRIRFALPQAAEIEIKVFEMTGRELSELASGARAAGNHEVLWNGRGRNGHESNSGVYLVRLRYRSAKNGAWSQLIKRVVLLK